VYVACSTLSFSRRKLPQALEMMAELGFTKVEVAVHERGPHLKPSEVTGDLHALAQQLKMGPGLIPAAFDVAIEASDPDQYLDRLQAVCQLARIAAVPLITLSAAPNDSSLDAEVTRLKKFVAIGSHEGVIISIATRIGTLTEDPDVAMQLCQRVPGLALTLDPSHFIAGPHQAKNHEHLYAYVKHMHLRDTGRGPNQFQVRVGQGEVEYGRIISLLARYDYDRLLSIEIRDIPDAAFPMEPEVRKLKYLLESMV
jgi:sugar phosphate isomerase/epimerase